jgi:hypothetical protein
MLCHESGQFIASTYRLKPAKEDPQGYGSALTYARRYGLAALLGIVADDDDDGNHASTPAPRPQPTPAPKVGPATQAAKEQAEKALGAKAEVLSNAWNPEIPEHQQMFMHAVSACGYDINLFKQKKLWGPFISHMKTIGTVDASVAALQNILFNWLKENMK